jgi:hypothetical protein
MGRCCLPSHLPLDKQPPVYIHYPYLPMPRQKNTPAKILKVAISVPNEAFILPECYENHILVAQHTGILEEKQRQEKQNPRFEFYRYTTGRLLTQMAREKLIEAALREDMDYIIMMDNDMIYPLDVVEALLTDMIEHPEIAVLAPLAFMRNPPHYAVMYTVTEGFDPIRHQDYYINNFVKNYPKDTLIECDAVGFGAACIRLDFVRKNMKAPYFMSTTNTGEDIWFCVQAKEAGGRVFMDTRIKLGHMANPKVIDEEFAEKYWKETKHDRGAEKHKYTPLEEDIEAGVVPHKMLSYTR